MVEPPVIATDAIAFSIAFFVIIWLGLSLRLSKSTARRPAWKALSGFFGSVAGMLFEPIGEIPKSSVAVAIVLAVNCPPHAPTPGHATSSSRFRSSSFILPAEWAPTASNTSWMETC